MYVATNIVYNPKSEVTSTMMRNGTNTYSYDWAGNRTFAVTNSLYGVAYTPNEFDQYANVNGVSPTYDADGNLTAIPGTCSMAYDGRNQMTFYSNASDRVWNTYDHQGRRVLKVSHGGTETQSWEVAESRSFLYDGWSLIDKAIHHSSFTLHNLYVRGLDLSGSEQGAGGIGGLLATFRNGDWYIPLADANGNITEYVSSSGSTVWVDLGEALAVIDTLLGSGKIQIRVRQNDAALAGICSTLSTNNAGAFLVSGSPDYSSAKTYRIPAEGAALPASFVSALRADPAKGVLLLEGREESTSPLVLEIIREGEVVCELSMPLSTSSVENMYRWINLRGATGGSVERSTDTSPPSNFPDSESNGTNVVFVHGFNVTEEQARGWNAEMFKRLWQSGSKAKYHAVIWCGDVGFPNGFFFHEDVDNAFTTAPHLRNYVNGLSGERIVLAHSLGNMVVSAAIAKYGLEADKYFMLNAAVAAEACDSGLFNDSSGNVMVHEDWQNITNTCWSAKYHELFAGTGDDRRNLTWKNFFANMLTSTTVYNVWSSGDEVLELHGGTPYSTTGVFDSKGRYSWHKQEIHKGRGALDPAGTSWAGWGMEDPSYTFLNPLIYTNQPPTQAEILEMMKSYPLFLQEPPMLFSSSITISDRDELLAGAIPALSGPMGTTPTLTANRRFDMNTSAYKADGGVWGRDHDDYGKRWLHSDIKNMAYFYVYKLFEKLVEEGDLK